MLDARDPVCGMTVEVTTAYSEAVGGDTYYFCSEGCRECFDEDPSGYGAQVRADSMPLSAADFDLGPEHLDGRRGPA
jgi:Cu+-exporting ATPase